MRAYFDEGQRSHEPRNFIVGGEIHQSPEHSARIDKLLSGIAQAQWPLAAACDHGLDAILAVHAENYLIFLQTIHARWSEQFGATSEVVPNIHPFGQEATLSDGVINLAGQYLADTACPIGPNTWRAAYFSAQTAVTAASAVVDGARAAYALCRPPGHHAYADKASGFCYLNNSAIAAQRLVSAGMRPAIIDVDVHHGNGTQGIFYERADVLTVSLHVDPSAFYPHYWGYSHENGRGKGEGYNLNLPLPRGADDNAYIDAISQAIHRAHQVYNADVIVVALGLDTAVSDPFRAMRVTNEGFLRAGQLFARSGLAVLFVQEGGYLSDDLGQNLAAYLSGFAADA